jgi:cation:H+ antiporter
LYRILPGIPQKIKSFDYLPALTHIKPSTWDVMNICNIALILGLAASIQPLSGHPVMVRRDVPTMLAASVLLLLSWNSFLSRLEGLLLFGRIVAYTYFSYALALKEVRAQPGVGEDPAAATDAEAEGLPYESSRIKQMVLIVAGLAGVIGGAEVLIAAAIKLMRILGVSEKFIGLTVVAVGTSLPELATSVVAAQRREMDISIGNIGGSNIFNIMGVLETAALVRPIPISGGFIASGLIVDYLVMLFISLLLWLMMRKKNKISRADGLVLLCIYVAYIVVLSIKD